MKSQRRKRSNIFIIKINPNCEYLQYYIAIFLQIVIIYYIVRISYHIVKLISFDYDKKVTM